MFVDMLIVIGCVTVFCSTAKIVEDKSQGDQLMKESRVKWADSEAAWPGSTLVT